MRYGKGMKCNRGKLQTGRQHGSPTCRIILESDKTMAVTIDGSTSFSCFPHADINQYVCSLTHRRNKRDDSNKPHNLSNLAAGLKIYILVLNDK